MKYYAEHFTNFPSLSPDRETWSPSCPLKIDISSGGDSPSGVEFSTFFYWKPVLPAIDDEITALLAGEERKQQPSLPASTAAETVSEDRTEDLTEFSEFNYWKVPVPAIDADLIEMMRCLSL